MNFELCNKFLNFAKKFGILQSEKLAEIDCNICSALRIEVGNLQVLLSHQDKKD